LDGGFLRQAFWDDLLTLLQSLAPDQREFLLRHYVGGEMVVEIARACGKTAHAVKQSLYRSREKLRNALESSGQT